MMKKWGGFSSRHLIERTIQHNSFVVAYDYDIKLFLVSLLAVTCRYFHSQFKN